MIAYNMFFSHFKKNEHKNIFVFLKSSHLLIVTLDVQTGLVGLTATLKAMKYV